MRSKKKVKPTQLYMKICHTSISSFQEESIEFVSQLLTILSISSQQADIIQNVSFITNWVNRLPWSIQSIEETKSINWTFKMISVMPNSKSTMTARSKFHFQKSKLQALWSFFLWDKKIWLDNHSFQKMHLTDHGSEYLMKIQIKHLITL